MLSKKCSKCNENILVSNFSKKGFRNNKQRYRSECKKCETKNKCWTSKLLSSISSRASRKRKDGTKRKSITKDESITKEFLLELQEKQKGKCYWLDIDIDFSYQCNLRKPSLDRLDNSEGYSKDNVVLTTCFANTGRRDAKISEMNLFVLDYLK